MTMPAHPSPHVPITQRYILLLLKVKQHKEIVDSYGKNSWDRLSPHLLDSDIKSPLAPIGTSPSAIEMGTQGAFLIQFPLFSSVIVFPSAPVCANTSVLALNSLYHPFL